ncbi:uncharacterized protein LOC129890483 [Solanum dulcamara]|uniref:uncharacterized protein LOC129890483 n=1 Tax=Solanum dulcamara TaxID=45834 RepID=UPI002485F4ED|nr:uncharacterized protein LOC129890483 [Solanum dulcamara]
MDAKASFSPIASPVFDGDNYQIWVVRMETYLDTLDLWEAVEEGYDIPSLPHNPTIAQIKAYKETKDKEIEGQGMFICYCIINIFHADNVSENSRAKKTHETRCYNREALVSKHQVNKNQNNKKNQALNEGETSTNSKSKEVNVKKGYPPCHHHGRKGHQPLKYWRRPNTKCNQLGPKSVIHKNKALQQKANAQVANQEEEDHLFVATYFSSKSSTHSWAIDSGLTNHMTHDKSPFKKLKPTEISKVQIRNGDHLRVKGIGTIVIKTSTDTENFRGFLCF